MLGSTRNCLIVGISGATCSGKTTLANAFHKVIPNSIALNQDQFYWNEDSENHTLADGFNHINWELVSAFDNAGIVSEVESLTSKSPPLKEPSVDYANVSKQFETLTDEAKNSETNNILFKDVDGSDHVVEKMRNLFSFLPRIIILDGILIFNHPELLRICDLKFFFTLEYKTCLERRNLRSYDPPDVPGYFEKIVYPYYVKNLEDMKKLDCKKEIVYLNGANDMSSNFKTIGLSIMEAVKAKT